MLLQNEGILAAWYDPCLIVGRWGQDVVLLLLQSTRFSMSEYTTLIQEEGFHAEC
jgi:hypothetical protein